LSAHTEKLGGDEWAAVRAWHAGVKGRNRNNGIEYERLIRDRIPEIAASIPRTWAGAVPPDEMLASRSREPVTIKLDEGTTPVRGRGVDYENA
jgi:hypothetical protein